METSFQILELLCKKCWRWQYLLQGSRNLSVNWNWSLHTCEPPQAIEERMIYCRLDEHRKGRNRENGLLRNHKWVCFDKSMESVVILSMLPHLNKNGWIYWCFDGIVSCIQYLLLPPKVNVIHFKRNCCFMPVFALCCSILLKDLQFDQSLVCTI